MKIITHVVRLRFKSKDPDDDGLRDCSITLGVVSMSVQKGAMPLTSGIQPFIGDLTPESKERIPFALTNTLL